MFALFGLRLWNSIDILHTDNNYVFLYDDISLLTLCILKLVQIVLLSYHVALYFHFFLNISLFLLIYKNSDFKFTPLQKT